jgi:hypothetical protein
MSSQLPSLSVDSRLLCVGLGVIGAPSPLSRDGGGLSGNFEILKRHDIFGGFSISAQHRSLIPPPDHDMDLSVYAS